MKKCFVFKVLALFLTFTLGIFAEKLELNLTKGTTYLQRISANSVISQEFGGQKFDMNMGVNGLTAFEVKGIKGSVYEMDVYYKEIGMNVEFFGSLMEFSSLKNDSTDTTSAILKNMTNQKFSIKMNKTGKILEIKNIENLYNNLFKGIDGVSQEEKEQIMAQMKDSFGEESFKRNIEMSSAIFPDKSIKVGDKWSISATVDSGFKIILDSTYELKEVTKDSFILEGLSKMKTGEDYVETNGIMSKYNLQGTMNATIKIDKKTGWTTEAKVVQDLSGSTFSKLSPEEGNEVESFLTMKTDMTMTAK